MSEKKPPNASTTSNPYGARTAHDACAAVPTPIVWPVGLASGRGQQKTGTFPDLWTGSEETSKFVQASPFRGRKLESLPKLVEGLNFFFPGIT